MQVAVLAHETDFEGWRTAARAFRRAGVAPERAAFRVGEGGDGLFDESLPAPGPGSRPFTVPKAFVDVASDVILHRSEDRSRSCPRSVRPSTGVPKLERNWAES